MNLKSVLISISFLVTQFAIAQHLNLGFKAGLNIFTIQNDPGSTNDSKLGLHAGLIGHTHFTKHFAMQPELQFSMKGAQNSISNQDTKLNLSYITLPILFQYMFNNGFRIQAGPEFGLLVQAKQKTSSSSVDVKDQLNSFDVGIAGGISYVHPPTGFGIDLRYVKGLSNINSEGSATSKNQGIQVGLFYLLKHN
ncbi:MAG: porin family protein [Saprospiraceae bacterium]